MATRDELEKTFEDEAIAHAIMIEAQVLRDIDSRFTTTILEHGKGLSFSATVWLILGSTHLLPVLSLDHWDNLKQFASVMSNPGDSKLEQMNIDFQIGMSREGK